MGKGFIRVHHLRELSSLGEGYQVNPVADLRPVCPNCHAMLHTQRPALLPEDLKRYMPTNPRPSEVPDSLQGLH
jgi:5-methylcytosine-specific restriction enzyme A